MARASSAASVNIPGRSTARETGDVWNQMFSSVFAICEAPVRKHKIQNELNCASSSSSLFQNRVFTFDSHTSGETSPTSAMDHPSNRRNRSENHGQQPDDLVLVSRVLSFESVENTISKVSRKLFSDESSECSQAINAAFKSPAKLASRRLGGHLYKIVDQQANERVRIHRNACMAELLYWSKIFLHPELANRDPPDFIALAYEVHKKRGSRNNGAQNSLESGGSVAQTFSSRTRDEHKEEGKEQEPDLLSQETDGDEIFRQMTEVTSVHVHVNQKKPNAKSKHVVEMEMSPFYDESDDLADKQLNLLSKVSSSDKGKHTQLKEKGSFISDSNSSMDPMISFSFSKSWCRDELHVHDEKKQEIHPSKDRKHTWERSWAGSGLVHRRTELENSGTQDGRGSRAGDKEIQKLVRRRYNVHEQYKRARAEKRAAVVLQRFWRKWVCARNRKWDHVHEQLMLAAGKAARLAVAKKIQEELDDERKRIEDEKRREEEEWRRIEEERERLRFEEEERIRREELQRLRHEAEAEEERREAKRNKKNLKKSLRKMEQNKGMDDEEWPLTRPPSDEKRTTYQQVIMEFASAAGVDDDAFYSVADFATVFFQEYANLKRAHEERKLKNRSQEGNTLHALSTLSGLSTDIEDEGVEEVLPAAGEAVETEKSDLVSVESVLWSNKATEDSTGAGVKPAGDGFNESQASSTECDDVKWTESSLRATRSKENSAGGGPKLAGDTIKESQPLNAAGKNVKRVMFSEDVFTKEDKEADAERIRVELEQRLVRLKKQRCFDELLVFASESWMETDDADCSDND